MPLVFSMNSEPAKPNSKGDDGQSYENVGAPCTKICERTQDEENNNLDGETDSVGEKHDRIDVSISTQEMQHLRVSCRFVHKVLKSCRAEVEEREAVVSDVVARRGFQCQLWHS